MSVFESELDRCFFSFEPGGPLAVFPYDQDRRGVENGGVRTAENTNQQDDHKVTDAVAAKQDQCKQRKHYSQLCGDGTVQCLNDGVIDHLFVFDATING